MLSIILRLEVVEAMQEKIKALKIPRGYAAVPVLFHLGGVAAVVETEGYFYRVCGYCGFFVRAAGSA